LYLLFYPFTLFYRPSYLHLFVVSLLLSLYFYLISPCFVFPCFSHYTFPKVYLLFPKTCSCVPCAYISAGLVSNSLCKLYFYTSESCTVKYVKEEKAVITNISVHKASFLYILAKISIFLLTVLQWRNKMNNLLFLVLFEVFNDTDIWKHWCINFYQFIFGWVGGLPYTEHICC